MRICFIQTGIHRRIDGVAITLWILTKELVLQGHEVCLITNPMNRYLHDEYPSHSRIHELTIADYSCIAKISLFRLFLHTIRVFPKILSIVGRFRPDIVCSPTEHPGLIALILKYLCRVRVIFFKSTNIFENWSSIVPFPKSLVLHILEKLFLFLPFDAFIGNATTKDVFLKLRGRERVKFFVVVPGIDADLFEVDERIELEATRQIRSKFGVERIILLYVGTLAKVKGLEYLVEAMKVLGPKDNCHLLIVGDGEEKNNIVHLVEEYNLKDHVTFEGAKPYSEIPKYVLASDIIVAPSLTELFGTRVMFDSWALKRPVVATKVGDVKRIARNREILVLIPPQDSSAIVEATRRIITNRSLRNKLVENAYKEAKKYSSKKLVESFLDACCEASKCNPRLTQFGR